MSHLPETGFIRLPQIIGQDAVNDAQAAENRRVGRHPRRPRPAIPAIIPVKKSTWWAGVKSGRYPKPTKALGTGVAAWTVEAIRELMQAARNETTTPNFEYLSQAASPPSQNGGGYRGK